MRPRDKHAPRGFTVHPVALCSTLVGCLDATLSDNQLLRDGTLLLPISSALAPAAYLLVDALIVAGAIGADLTRVRPLADAPDNSSTTFRAWCASVSVAARSSRPFALAVRPLRPPPCSCFGVLKCSQALSPFPYRLSCAAGT